jgi:hypothetical protein
MPDENALTEAIAEARKNIEQRVTALIEEARRENCLFFRCRLDLNAPALPIQIRFSDCGGGFTGATSLATACLENWE